MVHVAWVFVAGIVGGCFGAIMMCFVIVGKEADRDFETDWIQELENEK